MKLTQLIGFIFIIIFVFVGCNNSSNKTSSTNNNSTRDILNDNDHSISIVALDQFCPETLENWLCNEILIHNSLNQIDYKVRYSWNLVDDNNINSTTIWLAGSDGQWSSEISRQLSPTLNKLTDHKIRSVIINFSDENLSGRLGTGGYFKALDGYVNAAKAYDLVVRHMIKEGIINGTHLTHVGGSNGSTIAMFALAYHKADEYLDQVIFNAGPQPLLIEESCFNEDSSYSFDSGGLQIGLSLRRLIDLWNGWSSQRYCEKNILPPQHLLDKTSLFSAGAQRRFPETNN